VIPDTAVGGQTSFRPVDVINVGERTFQSPFNLRWTFEGPDAADFIVTPPREPLRSGGMRVLDAGRQPPEVRGPLPS
jgi:hypothetical protein